MNEPINIKDFYNHETRISIVENAILEIKESMKEIKSEIKDMRQDLSKQRQESINNYIDIRNESISHFRWLLTFIISGFVSLFGIIAHTQHWII